MSAAALRTHEWQLPVDEETVRSARVGDMIYLSGEIVITAGLPTHDRILEYLDSGRPLPLDLRGGSLLHLGSYNRESGEGLEIVYMNPTTSTRFNGHMPRLIRELNLRIVGGKGGLDASCAAAMREVGCVYVSFLGGGATLHTAAISEVIEVAWNDLIAHYRLVRLRVNRLGPLTVGIDATGASVYGELQELAQAKFQRIMAELKSKRQSTSAQGKL